jgi:hypothetical protein
MIVGLVDNRNSTLLKELRKNYKIKLELVNNTEEYGCYSINHRSIIYVPESKICAESFTHELLHIYLRSKGIFIGSRLKRKLQPSKTLSKIYSEQLLEHIGNCLDHIKMLPIYLKLGYDRRKFIHDYEKNKFTTQEIEQIKEYWKQGQNYNAQVVEFYLEKYFAAKACPNIEIDYRNNLQELSQLDEQLFQINEKLINRWTEMKIDSQEIKGDDYKIIAEDYIAEMKDWAESRKII